MNDSGLCCAGKNNDTGGATQIAIENDIAKYQDFYMGFVKDLLEAVPSFRSEIEAASNLILNGSPYNALKVIRKMIKREEEMLKVMHV